MLWIGGPAAAGETTVAAVESVFAERLAAGPVAATPADRRELLRYANETAVAHYRLSAFGRPGIAGDPAMTRQAFECECAVPACEEVVELAVGQAAARLEHPPPAIVAGGHQGSKRFVPEV